MKASEEMSHMGGTIARVDPQNRNLTVNSLIVTKVFKVADDAEIITPSKPQADLTDLNVADPVEVMYEQQTLVSLAHRVDVVSALKHQKAV